MDGQDQDTRTQVRAAYTKVALGADSCGVGRCGSQQGGSLATGYSETDAVKSSSTSEAAPGSTASSRRGGWASRAASSAST